MKKLLFIIILCAFGCITNQVTLKNNLHYEVVKSVVETKEKTYVISELRILNPSSALDATAFMRKTYGEWNQAAPGKYQENIYRYIWKNIKLSEAIPRLTIVTDGAESEIGYFTSFMVIDEFGKDCLNSDHPYSEQILNEIIHELNQIRLKNKDYEGIY